MNADGMNATAGSNPSGRFAKVVLWLAVGLFVVSQFLPFTADDHRFGWYFRDWVISFQEAWSSARPGSADWLFNMGLAGGGFLVFLFVLAIIVGGPWIMGFLRRARPILWIVRCLMLGLAGLIAFLIYWVLAIIDLNHYMGMAVQFPSPLSGTWVFLAALTINTLGLWMIPHRASPSPEGVPSA
jgi:hypothetical protein